MEEFEGRDFLATALLLATRADDEGSLRSAISRAYYACFHRARNYALERSAIIRQDGSAHGAVRRFLQMSDPKLAWDLQRLHVFRENADYDIPFPADDLSEVAQLAMDLAAKIIVAIDAVEVENEVALETQEE